jgi:hypothetical protein
MRHLQLFAILFVDRALQIAGNALLAASDRWLFATTADSPLEGMLNR